MHEPDRMSDITHASQMHPVLYSFRRCPYAMRTRLAIAVSCTPCLLREVKLSAKPEAMLAASPKGTVPVLVLPDGNVIDESLDHSEIYSFLKVGRTSPCSKNTW